MPTLAQALDTFLLVERRPATNAQYQIVLSLMVRAIGPDRDITLIRYEDLLGYQANLRERVKASTVAGYTSIMKSFFSWCVKSARYLEVDPADPLARKRPPRERVSRAIPADELRRMVDYTRATSPRNYAMLLFMTDTGCRVGGLVSLSRLHLHLDEEFAFIQEKGGQWLRVDFGEQTAEALAAWLKKRPECDHDFVWTGKAPRYEAIKRANVEYLVRSWSAAVGASREWNPHAIRHAVGEAWANAGIPAPVTQGKLGHAHISTTLNHYYPDDDPYVRTVSKRLSLIALQPEKIKTHGSVIELESVRRRQSGS